MKTKVKFNKGFQCPKTMVQKLLEELPYSDRDDEASSFMGGMQSTERLPVNQWMDGWMDQSIHPSSAESLSTFHHRLTRSSATAERQHISYTRLSRLTHWSCTSLNTASVVQLYNRLAKLVSTLSANKPCDIRGRSSFQTLYTFKVVSFYIIRKPLRAFITIHITNGHTSQRYLRRWSIMWIITKFSGSTPVRRTSALNPSRNSYKPHMLWNHSSFNFIGHFFVTDS